jgi:hypothetical protein
MTLAAIVSQNIERHSGLSTRESFGPCRRDRFSIELANDLVTGQNYYLDG